MSIASLSQSTTFQSSEERNMRNFRLLKADEIECRISTVSEKGVSLLLYKTARTDYQLLDETVGMYNWQNDYKVIDGKMYCGIGIRCAGGMKIDPNAIYNTPPEWVWKWNCGVESNTEAEKGQASDAMKRAGFCWGIGTELYSAPFIWIPADKCNLYKNEKGKLCCNDRFYVREIKYTDDEVINSLVIVKKNEVVYTFGLAAHGLTPQRKQSDVAEPVTQGHQSEPNAPTNDSDGEFQPTCADCGKPISMKVHDYSAKKFKKPLCMDCQKNYANR